MGQDNRGDVPAGVGEVKMMFCPKCKSIMMPKMDGKKRVLACGCGYKQGAESTVLKETAQHEEKKFEVVDTEATINTVVDAECPKCKNRKAENWEVQTRSADEPATRFFKCTECKHTWREYK